MGSFRAAARRAPWKAVLKAAMRCAGNVRDPPPPPPIPRRPPAGGPPRRHRRCVSEGKICNHQYHALKQTVKCFLGGKQWKSEACAAFRRSASQAGRVRRPQIREAPRACVSSETSQQSW